MLFSVIIATRDRPTLFSEALASVLAQQAPDFEVEVVVVNDGSSTQHSAAYQAIWDAARERLGDRFQQHSLVHRPKGHGQSYSLNYGVAQARGQYVCFLDDDDKWTDAAHLQRAAAAIRAARPDGPPVDLYMANQDAWIDERQQRVGTLWLGGLTGLMARRGAQPDTAGVWTPTVADLMACDGFCHLNCLVVRRALFLSVGGMDEGVRWECDRDVFLKLIEAASTLKHHPAVVSYHRVPDPAKANNMTTAMGALDKRLLQSIVLDRALARANHAAIRSHARQHKAYALERMAQEYARMGRWVDAALYAGQALGARPGPTRLLLWLRYSVRALLSRPQ